ncbi:Right handed beta helix region [Halopelagius inordinatus]|uniref:Right handed beta helix region n=1 Tax=Halopelagius inordinatus TaxID=553467 RepID=A0A1I2PHM3_9EURY|nr:Right handed beta helix region [Halopelagius inordinatus]
MPAAMFVGPVAAQTDSEVIDSCTVITEPGAYVVGENFSAENATQAVADPGVDANVSACIVVESDDVTLDGENVRMDGPVSDEMDTNETDTNETANESLVTGIAVTGDNVSVESTHVRDFDVGVLFAGASNSSLTEFEADDTERAGVAFVNASNNSVEDVNADDVTEGVSGIDDTESDSTNDTAENESEEMFAGAFVFVDASNNTVQNATVDGTTGWTVYSEKTAENETTENETVENETAENETVENETVENEATADANNSVENISVNGMPFSAEFQNANIGLASEYPDAPDDTVVVNGPLQTEVASDNDSIQLSFLYDDAGLEDAGTTELTLNIYQVSGDTWTEVDGAVIDVSDDSANAMVDNGTYALVGEVTEDEMPEDETETETPVENETETPVDDTVENDTETPADDTETPVDVTVENDTETPVDNETTETETETETATETETETETATETETETDTPTPVDIAIDNETTETETVSDDTMTTENDTGTESTDTATAEA